MSWGSLALSPFARFHLLRAHTHTHPHPPTRTQEAEQLPNLGELQIHKEGAPPLVEDLAHMRLDDSQKLLTVGRRVLVEDDGVGRVARLRFVDESGVCPLSPLFISLSLESLEMIAGNLNTNHRSLSCSIYAHLPISVCACIRTYIALAYTHTLSLTHFVPFSQQRRLCTMKGGGSSMTSG